MNTTIDLSGEWISSLIQNNKIYNEKVNFIQKENNLTANIILNYDDQICKYKFNGKINKNIINGTYELIDDSDIESGTISLRIVNENFLYGVTTYISDNENSDDIVQSPYALFRNTDNNLGTFDLCSNCVGKSATCCCNPHVDSPMILPKEAETISNNMKINIEEFDGIYEIKFNDNLECIYFKSWEMTI